MEEARNLAYCIHVIADTQQAEQNIRQLVGGMGGNSGANRINIHADTTQAGNSLRRLTGDLGNTRAQADTIGSAFRRSFLSATDSGRSFSQSLRSGVGGAFEHAAEQATVFSLKALAGMYSVGHGIAHPIQTIRTGFGNALQSVQSRFTRMMRGADDATDAINRMGDAAGNARGNVNSLGNAAEASGSRFSALGLALPGVGVAAAAAGAALVGFATTSVGVGMDFDKAMSQVAATMGKSVKDLQNEVGSVDTTFGHFEGNLREYAQFMGSNTAFSATEAANALNYMALAGYDTEKSMNMLPTVLNLAAAGNMELAAASDMVTDAASALGLTTEQTATMVDQMAMASSRSNTSVAQLGEAMLQVGGTAKVMAGGTQEISTVLGVLADNGIKGAEGGTHLRNMLLRMAKPTKDASAVIEKLGIDFFDAEGKMRKFSDIFPEMEAAMSSMSDEERMNAISTLFNSYDIASVNALLGTSKDRWNELDGAIEKAAGSAARMAATQLDNLEGDVTLFKSVLEGVQIAVADRLMPSLRAMTQVGGAALSGLTAVLKNEQDDLFIKTNMNVSELAKAMVSVGGAANELSGRGMEASTVLGILADNGLKGAEGGAHLRDMIVSLSQPTEAGSEALQRLGVDVKDADGNMRGFAEIFPELNEAMAGLTDDERRNAISALFNTNDIEAANALLGTTKERWTELGTSTGNLSTNMSNAIATVTDMASQGMDFAKTLAQGFAEGLPEFAAQLPLILASVFDFLAENSPAMIEQGGELLTFLGMGIINAIPALLSNLPTLIESIVGYIRAEAPALVQTGVELILHLAGGILNALPDVLVAVAQIGAALLGAAMEIPGLLVDVGIAIVKGLWTGISETGSWLIGQFTGFLGGIVDSAKAFLGIASPSKVFAEMGDNMALGIGEGFGNTIGGVIDFITSLLPTDLSMPGIGLPSMDDILGGLADIGMSVLATFEEPTGIDLASTGIALIQSLADGVTNGLPVLLGVLFPIPVMIFDFFTGEAPTFTNTGLDVMVAMATGVASGIGQVLDAVYSLASGILDALASLPGEMAGIGANIVQGVWQGISSAGGWLTSQVSGFFSNIVSNVKSTLGIASPSKVFAEIGDNMALGVGKGFGDSIGDVTKGIEKSMPTELDLPTINAPEVSYNVEPIIEQLPTDSLGNLIGLDIPEQNFVVEGDLSPIRDAKLKWQQEFAEGLTYTVSPIVETVDTPDIPDVSYKINPVVGELALPDVQRDELGNLLGIEIPDYNRITGDESLGVQADKLKAQEQQLADLLAGGMTLDISPFVEAVETPEIPDLTYGIFPEIEEFSQSLPDLVYNVVPDIAELIMPKADLPDETYGVTPIVSEPVLPSLPDVGFDVTPIFGDFKLPDIKGIFGGVKKLASNVLGDFVGPVVNEISGPAIDDVTQDVMDAAKPTADSREGGQETAASVPFAPNISITINGDASERTVENMRTSLYDTVKELFEEFREAEFERMALKNQYSFR